VGLGVDDIGDNTVISENKTRGSMFVSRKSEHNKSRSCFQVITCFAIQENQ
jgi:hypothetical protein